MFFKTLLLLFAFACFGWAERQDEVNELLENLKAVEEEGKEPEVDVFYDDDVMDEVRRIAVDRGMKVSDVMSDIGILKSIPGIFKNGDAKRWTTLNFAYQLACYGGIKTALIWQAWWAYKRFNGYACYCGAGYYKGNALDATDLCCKAHDNCYDRVMTKYKLKLGCDTYTVPYTVSCCKKERYTKCTDSGPSAGRELCECDQAMAKCTAKHATSYNEDFKKDKSKCKNTLTTKKKPMNAWEVLKSCKHAFHSNVKFPITYGSQGKCPNGGSKTSGWFWGR